VEPPLTIEQKKKKKKKKKKKQKKKEEEKEEKEEEDNTEDKEDKHDNTEDKEEEEADQIVDALTRPILIPGPIPDLYLYLYLVQVLDLYLYQVLYLYLYSRCLYLLPIRIPMSILFRSWMSKLGSHIERSSVLAEELERCIGGKKIVDGQPFPDICRAVLTCTFLTNVGQRMSGSPHM
jgi:hypothetical protein